MIDPKKASEDIRRSQFRVDVLDMLIDIANVTDIGARSILDKRIWHTLSAHGVTPSASDLQMCARFCQDGLDLGGYTELIELKLNSIDD